MTAESGTTTVSDIYPLSPAQQGVLFHTLSAPDSGVYFEQFSVRLEGKLDTAAFRAAWENVVHRHDVLRAALQWEGLEQPLMVVFDRVDLPWSEQDWRGVPAEDQQDRMQRSLAEQRVLGFDLASAPLLRVEVIRLDDAMWQVVWSFHHIVLDGWSSAAVLGELFTTYAALLRGTEPKLPPVRPYRDYIGWLQNQDLAAAEEYWRDLLADVSEP
ncbi:MAG TPA: non-ribosomal peptide synthetase, partial [Candidatus Nocardiopsis merdipullorum]|nr:non-ribosomal peptide synthetase [Candidatus Nocardiopsis merdipullorum]